ncbi:MULTISPECIES: ABC transporter ATP-binding protein [Mesorhizobium]|uniref:Amino acid transport ATP-binding protein n=2 Tax=Mesorhizobium TaxID=68287 RepID=G6YF85_9HYPH|nr:MULTISPECIES: ABC transporter ATP-binding protein [Mesorhizobium]ANT54730.1 ABC transporter ATP-binding protein [Mesorhizobium amorphae CCNWGS0123]EHH09566.1 amino acid transport ATP-binding protein [Mesorhizobium amorphae CCNWGS0123]MCV3243387.1 ABC transporter ATP-binding protein [Mesorhizobium sp. ZC-5]
MSNLLEIAGLNKRFGGLQAVDRCELSVREGSITGLIGPNGAGKTTLFSIISGFTKPDSGQIRFGGRRIEGLGAYEVARRGLRRTFQIPRELKEMSVLENLMLVPEGQFGDRLLSVLLPGARVRQEEQVNEAAAREVLETVGLAEKADIAAARLSGGQKKLLELARCLMSRPRLMLLDEPTAGVNPTLIRHLMKVMQKVHASGITLLIIEHNMNVIMELCERVVVLDRGHVIAAGTPAEIQQNKQVLDAYLGGVDA